MISFLLSFCMLLLKLCYPKRTAKIKKPEL